MSHFGRENRVDIGGKQYTLSRFERPQYEEFQGWAIKQLGDPLLELQPILSGFPERIQDMLVRDALERKKARMYFGNPEVDGLLKTTPGVLTLFSILIRKHHPELSESAIAELLDVALEQYGKDFADKVFLIANGSPPPDETAAKQKALGIGEEEQSSDPFRQPANVG